MNGIPSAEEGVFRQAGPGDDADLRKMVRNTPVDGWIRLGYEREPNYDHGCGIEGADHRTLIARDDKSGKINAMFSLSFRDRHIAGKIRKTGYISQLRVRPDYPGKMKLISDGFRKSKQILKEVQAVPFLLASIIEDNHRAKRILTSGLRGMPVFRPMAGLVTFALASKNRHGIRLPGLDFSEGNPKQFGEIANLLNEEYRNYLFAPVWNAGDLTDPVLCRGLVPCDFTLVHRGGNLIGCYALWDQRTFKQNRVQGYAPGISFCRPFINLASGLMGGPKLPPVGSLIKSAFLSHLAIADKDPVILKAVIAHACTQAAKRDLETLVFATDLKDPMTQTVRRNYRAMEYHSRIYLAHWPEGTDAVADIPDGLVQPEIAIL